MPISPVRPLPGRPALPESPPGRAAGEPGCACPPGQSRPLPDPAAVRLCLVPDSAPPYDAPALPPARVRWLAVAASAGAGAGGAGAGRGAAEGGQQEAGAGQQAEPARLATQAGHPEPAGRSEQAGHTELPASSGQPGSSRRPGSSAGAPAGQAGPGAVWPNRFAQALAETLAGTRPQRQMDRWTTERARAHIRRLGAQLSAGQQPRIRRVITTSPAPGVVEMTVIAGFGPQVRALAVRLEQTGATLRVPGRPARPARWVCTAVEAA